MDKEEVVEKLEELIKCPICLETCTNPRILQCSHVYCQKCLIGLVQRNQGAQGHHLTCPECRGATPMPPRGVEGLQSARHTNNLQDFLTNFKRADGVKNTGGCPEYDRNMLTKIPGTVSHHEELNIALVHRHRTFENEVREKNAIPDSHDHVLMHGPFDVTIANIVGVLGRNLNQSETTCGVAVNNFGMVIMSDEARHNITTFHPDEGRLRSFGTYGSGKGQLNSPRGVAADDEWNILVADCNNHRIQKFTAQGQFLEAVGSKGSGRLQFVCPKDIAVNPITKMVYVVDANHRVQILNSNLTYSKIFGTHGQNNSGQFINPHGIACDSTGNVYVADTGNHRIQVFSSRGDFILMFGHHGEGIGELDYPYGLVIDHRGLVYVSESNNNRVSVFTWDGQHKARVGVRHLDLFTKPRGLAVNSEGSVYVCDRNSTKSLTEMAYVLCVPKKKYKVELDFIKKWKYVIAAAVVVVVVVVVVFIMGPLPSLP